jgi:hypothetical protein
MNLLTVLIDAIKQRKLPMIVLSRDGLSASSKCPRCKAPVNLSFGAAGEHAFECASCGERGVWNVPLMPGT